MKFFVYLVILISLLISGCTQNKIQYSEIKFMTDSSKYNKLTPDEEYVIINKGTERPFSGEYENFSEKGIYVCKRCNAPLYKSEDKFDAQCGWPSFDDEIPGAVKRVPDKDGMRTEIICNNCGAHLGHVFLGEGFTDKNTRHCVNSISLKFIPQGKQKIESSYDTAYFAGGCFWGTDYFLKKKEGVISVTVGYTGGTKENPTYEEVCSHTTGHYEANEVVFDSSKISYEDLTKYFFEIHDPEQTNGQGPDIGEQYLSVIFYKNKEQKLIAENLIKILTDKGFKVATKLLPSTKFWKAENYHQDYYEHKGSTPYCHKYTKRF
jgi:peptide methionine sulfoxide reductase msrA/msrB